MWECERSDVAGYGDANRAKACFDNVYTNSTPHDYIAMMAKNGYEIGEQARPYCKAAAELLAEQNEDAWPVQMLDVGCSYGMGSAFVKYGCSFDEIVAFFSTRAPQPYHAAHEATRMWLNVTSPACDVRCVGLDSSKPAIRFAMDAGLLDGGIARDFEKPGVTPTEEECAWLRSCNLLISTGAIGYVTKRTFDTVLRYLGKNHPGDIGPYAVFTILRVFDSSPIKTVFEKHGFTFGKVPGVMLPQRRFTDEAEREQVLALLHDRGIRTCGWENQGKYFAELYVADRSDHFSELFDKMIETRSDCLGRPGSISYIRR